MKKLLREMKHYRKEVVLAPLFKLLEAGLDLLVPLVMQAIIDTGIPNQDKAYIGRMCLLLGAFALVGLGLSAVGQYFSAKAATGFSTRLRHMVFRHIQVLEFNEFDHIGASTLLTRMSSDINQIQSGVNLTLRLFLRSPFVVFGAMIMAFTIDVKAALIFAVVIPILCVIVFGIMLGTVPMYKRVQGALDKVTGRTRENLTGVRVLRAFHQEDREEEAFFEENSRLKSLQVAVGRISAFLNPVTYVIINLAVIFLIRTGAIRVSIGILTQGAVVALVNYMNQILVELIKMADLIINMTRAAACGNRISEILEIGGEKEAAVLEEETSEEKTVVPEGTPKIEFSHVSMHYGDVKEEAVTDLSFTIAPGETIGVIGGTGSGKSTLVHLIPGFYPISSGSLKIDGKEASDYHAVSLRSKVGIVLQKATLFTGTIRENLLWGNENATEEELKAALVMAQAWEFVKDKEGGLDAKVEQEGRNFSGGQKQRLSIARALVRKPEILILDDSASALDYATDAALRASIAEHNPDMTVIIVAQRAASVVAADRILVLDDGELVGNGTHAELLETCPVYKEIYETR